MGQASISCPVDPTQQSTKLRMQSAGELVPIKYRCIFYAITFIFVVQQHFPSMGWLGAYCVLTGMNAGATNP